MLSATAPETDAATLGRCAVVDAGERLSLLRALASEGEMVTLFAGGDPDCFVASRLLEVDVRQAVVDLEFKTDEGRVDAFRRADGALAVALRGGVKLQFRLERCTLVGGADRARLRAPLPDAMWRLQRRDAYRVAPHALADARLWIGDGADAREVDVLDVSATGVGIAWPADAAAPAAGERLSACRLELPAAPPIRCALRVRAVEPGVAPRARVGCEFETLDPAAARAVQVFVNLAQTRGRRLRPRLG